MTDQPQVAQTHAPAGCNVPGCHCMAWFAAGRESLRADLDQCRREREELALLLRNNQLRAEEVEDHHGVLLRENTKLRAVAQTARNYAERIIEQQPTQRKGSAFSDLVESLNALRALNPEPGSAKKKP